VSRVDAWIARTGMRPDVVKWRVLAGVVIGLMVVMIDRLIGFGS